MPAVGLEIQSQWFSTVVTCDLLRNLKLLQHSKCWHFLHLGVVAVWRLMECECGRGGDTDTGEGRELPWFPHQIQIKYIGIRSLSDAFYSLGNFVHSCYSILCCAKQFNYKHMLFTKRPKLKPNSKSSLDYARLFTHGLQSAHYLLLTLPN